MAVVNKEELSLDQKLSSIIDKKRRTCTLSNAMIQILIKQIGHELQNRHIYMTFANYFKVQGLTKLYTYFHKRSEEENHHAQWIIDYLNTCDAQFSMPKITEAKLNIKNMEYPFDVTVDLEIYTTMCINEIVKLADSENDYATALWLRKPGKLVEEQIEEERTSRVVANIAHMDTDWVTKQDSILEYYDSL